MIQSETLLGLPGYQITGYEETHQGLILFVHCTGAVECPDCDGRIHRSKGCYERRVRHHDIRGRPCYLRIRARKWHCQGCGRHFRQRLPGILPWQRSSEAFREFIFGLHRDGINRSCLGRRETIGAATVDRHFQHGLQRQFREWHPAQCPPVLGIDEHFFTRRLGFATTLCDLKKHKVYDVVLGRSELSLEAYFQRLEGKTAVRVVCMDLATCYRSLVRKHFPQAQIVADRFHVVRLVNHHFLACWRELDPAGSRHRGLLKLMRRHGHNLTAEQRDKLNCYLSQHAALEQVYRFKQRLMFLLLVKQRTRKQCQRLIPRYLRAVAELRQAGFPPLVQLGDTLHSWSQEIVTMWRFSRNNGITEGFHNKMELINRQAYGFRNFENYRRRVKVLCA